MLPFLQKSKYKYPIIKGDAVVINLVQGLEFTEIPIIIDIDSFFAFGSIYTAISRVKHLSQLYVFVRDNKEKIFQPDL